MFAVAGLGNTVYHPADYALLARYVPPERAGRTFSYHTFSGMLGNAVARRRCYICTRDRMAQRLRWRRARGHRSASS